MKKIFAVFLLAFFLNIVWENTHAPLYLTYKGKEITQGVLLHATLADAIYITVTILIVRAFSFGRSHPYSILIFFFGILALGIEWWALATHRWVYSLSMPIIPFLNIGFSPAIQLAMTGCVTYWFIFGRLQKS